MDSMRHVIHRRGWTMFPSVVRTAEGRYQGTVNVLCAPGAHRVRHYCLGAHATWSAARRQAERDADALAERAR